MYKIEYYKTKREKPNLKDGGWYNQEVLDTCWNIKTLTIDKKDIDYIRFDRELFNYSHLVGLFTKARRTKSYNDLTTLIILNNNYINHILVYEIINCAWMVNQDELKEELDTLKFARTLGKYIRRYDRTNDSYQKECLKTIIDYYIDTITNGDKQEQKTEGHTLKFGTYLFTPKK